ncbi:MAG: hypothetical protein ACOCSE_02760 [Chitinivibrionales bacterium]
MTVSVQKHGVEFEKGNSGKLTEGFRSIFLEMRRELVSKLFSSSESEESGEAGGIEESTGLPEYWNAENTSQRIMDFAVSFFTLSDMDRDEYAD